MTKTEVQKAVAELPKEEQLELLQEIWGSLAPEVELRLTPELRQLLSERLAAAKANPDAGEPLEAVHERLRKSIASGRG